MTKCTVAIVHYLKLIRFRLIDFSENQIIFEISLKENYSSQNDVFVKVFAMTMKCFIRMTWNLMRILLQNTN